MRLLETLLDIVYPRECPVCGGKSDREGRFICWRCLSSLPIRREGDGHCSICGFTPCEDSGGAFVCQSCASHRPAFDLARSALDFIGPVRDLVHGFKYNGQTWLRRDFGDIIEAAARTAFDVREIDVIVPVPLFAAKFVQRSYNQSQLLSAELSDRIGVRHDASLLQRLRDTPTQTHLGPEARRKNISRAFGVPCPGLVHGRTVLVVDDVMTTGATLGEIARTLKAAGAWRVWCLTLCRATLGK